jgi:hypothetical protein
VGDVDEFLANVFTTSPHMWRHQRFDDLLSVSDVDSQLSGGGLRWPAVRLVRDGEVIERSQWTKKMRTGSTSVDDVVHAARVFALFDDGATIVLQGLQQWWHPLSRFCRDIERVLGHAVQANAYLSPPGTAGLAPHHDTHDVFVLQVHGTKHWTVREPVLDDPLPRHHSRHEQAAAQPVLFEADLRAGDCLYLPRGVVHSAATQTGASLHLTIGVLAMTVHDLLGRLVSRAADEASFRKSLPALLGSRGDLRGDVVKSAVAEFIGWLEDQLLEMLGVDDIEDDTILERRADITCELTQTGERLQVVLGDRTLDLPAAAHAPVRLLLDGVPHRVGDLQDVLDAESRLVLARRLVREGVVRTVHGP